jgi:hypothetical protein
VSVLAAIRAERMKVRKTLFFRLAFWFPFVTWVMPAAFFLRPMRPGGKYPDASILAESMFSIWSRMMLPVFAVMISIAAYQNEHTLSMWKHLNALPSRGRPQLLAKHAVLALAAVYATIWTGAIGAIGSFVLKELRPEMPFEPSWTRFATGLFVLLLEAISVTAITSVVAERVRVSYVGATLGFGALGCVVGNALPSNDVFPWSYGDTWSRILGNFGGYLGPYSVTTVAISAIALTIATIVLHLEIATRRPHY